MRIAVDTNVLLRMMVDDDSGQKTIAKTELDKATSVAISVSSLCEMVWVLRRKYNFAYDAIEQSISALIDSENVLVNRPVVNAGLQMLKMGGDFADGVIAYEGQMLGADEFLSFDKIAVKKLNALKLTARLLGTP